MILSFDREMKTDLTYLITVSVWTSNMHMQIKFETIIYMTNRNALVYHTSISQNDKNLKSFSGIVKCACSVNNRK